MWGNSHALFSEGERIGNKSFEMPTSPRLPDYLPTAPLFKFVTPARLLNRRTCQSDGSQGGAGLSSFLCLQDSSRIPGCLSLSETVSRG